MALDEYEISNVIGGQYEGKTIRAARWVIQNGTVEADNGVSVGDTVHLVVEPYQDNPQIESLYLFDTLPPNFDLVNYFDVKK